MSLHVDYNFPLEAPKLPPIRNPHIVTVVFRQMMGVPFLHHLDVKAGLFKILEKSKILTVLVLMQDQHITRVETGCQAV